jgi:hypothetical protein
VLNPTDILNQKIGLEKGGRKSLVNHASGRRLARECTVGSRLRTGLLCSKKIKDVLKRKNHFTPHLSQKSASPTSSTKLNILPPRIHQTGTNFHPLWFRPSPCSLGLSATSQQYFSLTTNQPPAISQQYYSLRTNQHQPSATSQPNRLRFYHTPHVKPCAFCPFLQLSGDRSRPNSYTASSRHRPPPPTGLAPHHRRTPHPGQPHLGLPHPTQSSHTSSLWA